MIWEPGKTYAMDGGGEALIYEICAEEGGRVRIFGKCRIISRLWSLCEWNSDGKCVEDWADDAYDLLPPEPRKRTVWVNLYACGLGDKCGHVAADAMTFDSKDAAESAARASGIRPYLGAFPVEIVEKTP